MRREHLFWGSTMRKAKLCIPLIAILSLSPLLTAPAEAQNFRSWVSRTGDDSNLCVPQQPCRSFVGALAKTNAGGEILCIDASEYGNVTLTQSITIDCTGTLAVITNITINALPTDVVRIRNVKFAGHGVGANAIIINSAGIVHLENLVLESYLQPVIRDVRTGPSKLIIKDTIVRDNTGVGILVAPTGGSTIGAVLDNVTLSNNTYGVAAGAGARVTVARSVLSWNSIAGAEADPSAFLILDNNVISNNTTGVAASGGSNVFLSNNNIVSNNTAILGVTTSYGNNRLTANIGLGTASTPAGSASPDVGQK
jgi:hypothetical protein